MDQVNQNATFQHDDTVFHRVRYAQLGMKLIDEHPSNKGACTIAVDAPWGIGKSTFLHMWRHEIKACRIVAENDFAVMDTVYFERRDRVSVYYNAWEHDDSEDAFAPLLWTIISVLVSERYKQGMQISADKVLEAVAFVTTAFAALQPQNATALAAAAITNAAKTSLEAIKNSATSQNVVETIFKQQQDQQNKKSELRRCLSDLACACGKLVIFVDELDRCKPSFAIDTLETIKHYFDIPNLAFVFGIDMTQLGHAIAGRYGRNMDTSGYLSKFFDHHLRLPAPSARQMITLCGGHLSLSSEREEHIEQIFMACSISPREIASVYESFDALYKNLKENLDSLFRNTAVEFLLLLIAMRARKKDIYELYINGDTTWDKDSWNDSYPYLYSLLNRFVPFMSRRLAYCSKLWDSIVIGKWNSASMPECDIDTAHIGFAILQCRDTTDADSFAHILSAFMEQVYI